MEALGRHILVEFYGCTQSIIDDEDKVRQAMTQAAEEAGATIVTTSFHRFSPQGISGVVVIEESHLAIHTWPEFGFVAVDLFTCGTTVDPWIAYEVLEKQFEANHGSTVELHRGQKSLLSRPKS